MDKYQFERGFRMLPRAPGVQRPPEEKRGASFEQFEHERELEQLIGRYLERSEETLDDPRHERLFCCPCCQERNVQSQQEMVRQSVVNNDRVFQSKGGWHATGRRTDVTNDRIDQFVEEMYSPTTTGREMGVSDYRGGEERRYSYERRFSLIPMDTGEGESPGRKTDDSGRSSSRR